MATETKATPGPWQISEIGPLDCLKPTRDNCIEINSERSVLWVAQVLRRNNGEANALLISLSPELLETLKAVTAELNKVWARIGQTNQNEYAVAAEKLIARAEGK